MWIKTTIFHCDFSDRKYPQGIDGAGALAQGATGRWCVVMWAGPEEIEKQGIEPEDPEVVRTRLNEEGNGWCDF